jgi:hypothetical protein
MVKTGVPGDNSIVEKWNFKEWDIFPNFYHNPAIGDSHSVCFDPSKILLILIGDKNA